MKTPMIAIGNKPVGEGYGVYVIAEIGVNHNGSVAIAKKLIDAAVLSGCDAVKFQKRTPELCTPRDQWDVPRVTPWGETMSYIEYRRKMEFTHAQYDDIAKHCDDRGIHWFASCWDEPSVDFIEQYHPPVYKVPSACITDHDLLRKTASTRRPIMLSTGMSTLGEIDAAVNIVGRDHLLIAHATSTYPCPVEELNLRMMATLKQLYPECPVGYSGHEVGLSTTWAAVALGATFIERHITLDRAMKGSDHAASVEVGGLMRLVSNIREIEKAIGDGVKQVYESEHAPMKRLRRVYSQPYVNA